MGGPGSGVRDRRTSRTDRIAAVKGAGLCSRCWLRPKAENRKRCTECCAYVDFKQTERRRKIGVRPRPEYLAVTRRPIIATSPDGGEERHCSLSACAKAHPGMSPGGIGQVLAGHSKQHRGWTFRDAEQAPSAPTQGASPEGKES